jgi:crotonobetainyl-CoA:carnitine CoA-transferase CaiB-like acyl-CoA transferase
VQIADIGCGAMTCAVSILGALVGRERTGEGQYLDVSMLDGVVSWMSSAIAKYYAEGEPPAPGRQTFSGEFPSYHIYKTKDGKYVSLGCVEAKFWVNFCEAVGRPELSGFHLPHGEKQKEVFEEVEKIFLTKKRDEWVQFLDGVDTCFAPVNDISETVSDPQVRHRGLVSETDYGEGKMIQVAFPARFSGCKFSMRSYPPGFGEHTEETLKELGYPLEEIKELREKGVI